MFQDQTKFGIIANSKKIKKHQKCSHLGKQQLEDDDSEVEDISQNSLTDECSNNFDDLQSEQMGLQKQSSSNTVFPTKIKQTQQEKLELTDKLFRNKYRDHMKFLANAQNEYYLKLVDYWVQNLSLKDKQDFIERPYYGANRIIQMANCLQLQLFSKEEETEKPQFNSITAPMKYQIQQFSLNEEECSICLQNMNMKLVSQLDCGHIFCANCIMDNINKYKKFECPLCRRQTQNLKLKVSQQKNPQESIEVNVETIKEKTNDINQFGQFLFKCAFCHRYHHMSDKKPTKLTCVDCKHTFCKSHFPKRDRLGQNWKCYNCRQAQNLLN